MKMCPLLININESFVKNKFPPYVEDRHFFLGDIISHDDGRPPKTAAILTPSDEVLHIKCVAYLTKGDVQFT